MRFCILMRFCIIEKEFLMSNTVLTVCLHIISTVARLRMQNHAPSCLG